MQARLPIVFACENSLAAESRQDVFACENCRTRPPDLPTLRNRSSLRYAHRFPHPSIPKSSLPSTATPATQPIATTESGWRVLLRRVARRLTHAPVATPSAITATAPAIAPAETATVTKKPVTSTPKKQAATSKKPTAARAASPTVPLAIKRRIAIVNHKGGVGKTTCTIHLAGAIASLGYRVLVVDCDSSGDLSWALLANHESLPYSVADIFAASVVPTAELIQHTEFSGIDIIPADGRLRLFDQSADFATDPRATLLAFALQEVEATYDVILFDSSPRQQFPGFAAMVAAQEVLIPCQPSSLSIRGIRSVEEQVQVVRHALNPQLAIRGFFLSMVDARSATQTYCRELLVNNLGEDHVLGTMVPNLKALDTALNLRKPIAFHAKTSKAAQVFAEFAKELLATSSGSTPPKSHVQSTAA